jgi:hypothetical protein
MMMTGMTIGWAAWLLMAPAPAAPDLTKGELHDLPAVELPKGCGATFPALTVKPAEAPLARTLVKLWDKSTRQRSAAAGLTCNLSLKTGEEGGLLARMACGPWDVEAETSEPRVEEAVPVLAQGLVQGLLQHVCAKP